jgi:hypothetical protein
MDTHAHPPARFSIRMRIITRLIANYNARAFLYSAALAAMVSPRRSRVPSSAPTAPPRRRHATAPAAAAALHHLVHLRRHIDASGLRVRHIDASGLCVHATWMHQACVYDTWMHQACVYATSMHQACVYDTSMHQACVYDTSMHQACVYATSMHQACVYATWMHQACVYDTWMHQACVYDTWMHQVCVYDTWMHQACVRRPLRVSTNPVRRDAKSCESDEHSGLAHGGSEMALGRGTGFHEPCGGYGARVGAGIQGLCRSLTCLVDLDGFLYLSSRGRASKWGSIG